MELWFVRKLDKHLEEYSMVVLFTVMVIVLFAQIVSRAFLNNSITWSEELVRYCFTYLVFLGVSYAVKKKQHLKLTIVFDRLGKRGKIVLLYFSNLTFLLFAIFIFIFSLMLVLDKFKFGQVTPSLGISKGWVYAAAPIGMFLTTIRLIQNIFSKEKLKIQ